MKNKALILLFIFSGFQFAYSQNTDKCRRAVIATIEAINSNDAKPLKPFLARNFSIADQTGFIAKMVLQQLFIQIDETVISSEETGIIQGDGELILEYEITYKEMGVRNSTFHFNNKNKLTEMKLFDMHVMTMEGEPEPELSTSNVIEVPFCLAGKLIMVDVVLDGIKRKFIIDSGSPQTILNSKYTSMHFDASKKVNIGNSQGVNGEISGVEVNRVDNLDFYGIKLSEQNILTMYLGHLEEEINDTIYGLIGYDMIHSYDIVFDYKEKVMTLIEPDYYKNYEKDNFKNCNKIEVKLKMQAHIPMVRCNIGDNVLSLGIDTGAETNLLDAALYSKLKQNLINPEITSLLGADNTPVEVQSGVIRTIDINKHLFTNQETVFSNLSHLNEGYKIALDGLVGYEVLSRDIVVLSYKKKKLFFYF